MKLQANPGEQVFNLLVNGIVYVLQLRKPSAPISAHPPGYRMKMALDGARMVFFNCAAEFKKKFAYGCGCLRLGGIIGGIFHCPHPDWLGEKRFYRIPNTTRI